MYKEKKVSVIIAAAGSAVRMGGVNKQYIEIGGMSVLARSAKAFERNAYADEIIIAVRPGDEENCRQAIVEKYGLKKVKEIVAGGAERQFSVMKALEHISEDAQIVLVHDGARPFVTQRLIHDIIDAANDAGAAVPCVEVKDTIKVTEDGFVAETPERATLRAVQTPQGFDAALLKEAYRRVIGEERRTVTDDASVVEAYGHEVAVVASDLGNVKITTPEDVHAAELMIEGEQESRGRTAERGNPEAERKESAPGEGYGKNDAESVSREAAPSFLPYIGTGWDAHAFAEGRRLVLGGVEIPHDRGLEGHSDADVLIHAVIDALLGAAGLGDIGKHFPDTDEAYRGISSLVLLERTAELLEKGGFQVVNIDTVVIAQRPKIAAYTAQMCGKMAEVLKISPQQINIKGTTAEGLGFTGREEGIAAQAAACLVKRGVLLDGAAAN